MSNQHTQKSLIQQDHLLQLPEGTKCTSITQVIHKYRRACSKAPWQYLPCAVLFFKSLQLFLTLETLSISLKTVCSTLAQHKIHAELCNMCPDHLTLQFGFQCFNLLTEPLQQGFYLHPQLLSLFTLLPQFLRKRSHTQYMHA